MVKHFLGMFVGKLIQLDTWMFQDLQSLYSPQLFPQLLTSYKNDVSNTFIHHWGQKTIFIDGFLVRCL